MFPRPMEWWSLPRMVDEFADWKFPQFWDDKQHLSRELKTRIIPEIEIKTPWDLFILFGPDATWADAQEHVLGWDYPVIGTKAEFDALLGAVSERGGGQSDDRTEDRDR